MKLHAWVGGPFDPIQTEHGTQQPVCGGDIVLRWHTQRHQERISEEDQLTILGRDLTPPFGKGYKKLSLKSSGPLTQAG